jgi:2-hydroxychromene-2-carboxylate isomerase
MTQRVDYFYDYVSPFTYMADSRLAAIAERTGAEFVFRPMVLGGVFKATGNGPPAAVPAKGKYMSADIARWAKRYGLPLQFNPHFPVNTIHALRGALVAHDEGVFPQYHQAIFRAVWENEQNAGDKDVLRDVVKGAGIDGDLIVERTGEQAIKDRLRAHTDEAVERGAFGSPTFFLGDEMFFGNDRLDFLEELLRG